MTSRATSISPSPGKSRRANKASNPDVRRFRALTEEYIDGLFALFPETASALGLAPYDGELGPGGEDAHRAYGEMLRRLLPEVEALPGDRFGGEDSIDRRGFLAMLRTGLLDHDHLRGWRANPQQACQTAVESIFLLTVRHAERLEKVLPAIESRLAKIPRFLDAGADAVRHPVPLWVELAEKSCAGAEKFLEGLRGPLVAAGANARRLGRLLEGAKAAFRGYARAVGRKRCGAEGGFAVGRSHFELLVRERTGLDASVGEIEALGKRAVEGIKAELKAEARRLGFRSAEQAIDEARGRWRPAAGDLLEEYRRQTGIIRRRFERARVLTFPESERLKIIPVPDFLRHQFPTAAYMSPPPFASDQTGVFYVNDLSVLAADERARAREVAQHFGLELTCAHEAYPGHHLQFCIQNRHPSRIRRLMGHAIFYEGWTLWCERLCIDLGIYRAPSARLLQLHDSLWRAHRILIDCGLHTGRLSYRAACRQLERGVGFTRARARADVNWYTAAPTVPMSYLLGRFELEKLYAEKVTRGGWTMRKFHDWILGFGAVPWRWIREAGD